ncbi:DNA repair protein RadA [Campylobacter geochelonis]|uniref:DNA repair protein RadA n=1 Tax=Campylobacter geochelonis TaxID=1780362 RepID=A0A128EGD2_9BACT|nr:DNA repair protein RadA [Campylobacter geochelonis]QKF71717.1 DNA repair and recombination protein [Campylobacter geochelonis]CZE47667.1 DNA repair protein RadA [Campylobacter geochelonis]CZE48573.1 DNA repair protein RadA [Campylobacter geochelonis]
MAKAKLVFECSACGNRQSKWMGKCPECGSWDSFVELNKEQIEFIEKTSKVVQKNSCAQEICDIKIEEINRISTDDTELDLVLGGGIVDGSLVLIGGSPGIGKSTLLLKIGSNLAKKNINVLYVSGEESLSQIKMRADRLNAVNKNLFLLTEISLENIKNELLQKEYKILIIDSIQTLFSEQIASAPGSVSQVREITFELMRIAKERGICVFIIGHITKEGSIAGPRILEHMVDVVLYFEGDASKELRLLRGFKNRFGSTSEVGIFEMSAKGLISAKDIASKFFTRGKAIAGSAITIIMEGSRPLSVEIQALVCESAYPKRSVTGYDRNRLDMILALLERKIGIALGHYDVFVNVTGGVKISETAADLAVVAAIVSSFKNRPISKESAFIGEVSLNGEIRDVFNLDARVKEAKMQKFKSIIAPSKPLEEKNIKIFIANEINQVLEWM